METDNHPMHSDSKVPVKVDTDIRKAMIKNHHLKTSDIITGMLAYQSLYCVIKQI